MIPLKEYEKIYDDIENSKSIASILRYNKNNSPKHTIEINKKEKSQTKGCIAIIGAGNYTKMTMLPALNRANANIKHIVSSGGVNGTALAQKYNIAKSTTDYELALDDSDIDLVMITTRHNLHADMVIKALNKGKHVFVEKPLALNDNELVEIEKAYNKNSGTLMIGYNRRFSPHLQKIKSLVGNAPMNIIATMNAGEIPADIWVHDMKVGGGRIIGEACHYLDLLVFISGSKIKSVCINALGENPTENTDNASILVKMENGSTGVINYFANGAKSYSKERLEVYSQNKVLIMDNFMKTSGFGFQGFSKLKTRLDKGHRAQFEKIVEKIKQGSIDLIPFEELVNVTKASFAAIKSLKKGSWVSVN